MNNVIDLHKVNDIWTNEINLKEIRLFVSTSPLTDLEFKHLVNIGRKTQLNPYLREIWAVKYSPNSPAQIFIGRDGYRLGAQRQPEYEYHQVESVYSNDQFEIVNGDINHRLGFGDRGELLGAYCIVKRKSSSKPTYVTVTLKEYGLNQGLWKTKPETMIKKVAEAQALRQSFQSLFGGTYSDAELPEKPLKLIEGGNQVEKLNHILEQNELGKDGMTEEIKRLIQETGLSPERLNKALMLFHVDSIEEMDEVQQDSLLKMLNKIKDKMRN